MAADASEALYSESIRIESKVLYADLRVNTRGQYLKLSETGGKRPRSTILMPAAAVQWLFSLLDYYIEETAAGRVPGNKELAVENKVFHFAAASNERGRYLRISEAGVSRSSGRHTLIIPCGGDDLNGWLVLRDCVRRLAAYAEAGPGAVAAGGGGVISTAGDCDPPGDPDPGAADGAPAPTPHAQQPLLQLQPQPPQYVQQQPQYAQPQPPQQQPQQQMLLQQQYAQPQYAQAPQLHYAQQQAQYTQQVQYVQQQPQQQYVQQFQRQQQQQQQFMQQAQFVQQQQQQQQPQQQKQPLWLRKAADPPPQPPPAALLAGAPAPSAPLPIPQQPQQQAPASAAAGVGGARAGAAADPLGVGSSSVVGPGNAPPSLSTSPKGTPVLSCQGRRVFFDLGASARGRYLRITEVSPQAARCSIVIPAAAVPKFQEAVGTCAVMLEQQDQQDQQQLAQQQQQPQQAAQPPQARPLRPQAQLHVLQLRPQPQASQPLLLQPQPQEREPLPQLLQ